MLLYERPKCGDRVAKFEQVAEVLEQRIRHGDYRLGGFPSHSELVSELGVNSRTLTKAITELVQRGVLLRSRTGRVELPDQAPGSLLHVGVLSPAFPSAEFTQWYRLIDELCRQRGWMVKSISYTHWHDAAIGESLRGLDGLFFLSIGDDFPPPVIEQIRSATTPVVVLEQDVSAHGIPSLRNASARGVQLLVEHLHELGHTHIACLNTQPISSVIRGRIESWRLWLSAMGLQGRLIDEPVELYHSAAARAHEVMGELLDGRALAATALVCTTSHAAVGALRALADRDLRAGVDLAVCAADSMAGLAALLTPSLTHVYTPSIAPLMQVCLEYFGRGGADWVGPLLIEPATMELGIGESTTGRRQGPPPTATLRDKPTRRSVSPTDSQLRMP